MIGILLIFIFAIKSILIIKCINNITNSNENYLKTPSYVLDSYLLLMFNGTQDLHSHAQFSQVRDDHEDCIKYRGKWNIEVTNSTPYVNDYALVLKSRNSHAAIAFGFRKPFKFESSCLIVQYDFRFPNDHECGGAYVKLLSESINFDIKEFSNSTPFTIMFGPDKCGIDYEIKFLFEYPNPKTGEYSQRKFRESEEKYPRFLGDNITHVNTLMICDNNTVQIYKDLRLIKEGNLKTDFEPPLGGELFIIDNADVKPKDWDEREEIPDPNARKPDDWDDEPEFILDTEAKKPKNWLDNEPLMVKSEEQQPRDWDEDENGKWNPHMVKNYKCKINGCGPWSPPKIRNVKYRGKWIPPLIRNPNNRGVWKPRMIKNPDYIEDSKPYKKLLPFSTLGIEIWSQNPGLIFDNFIIADNLTVAREFAMQTWWPKYLVDTKDMPEYQSIFNKPNPVRKSVLLAYIHWFWAIIPLLLGLPIFSYIITMIVKKSNRNPNLIKEKLLLKVFQNITESIEVNPFDNYFPNNQDPNSILKNEAGNVSDEAINQMFGGADDKVATVIRKRYRNIAMTDQIKPAAGDK